MRMLEKDCDRDPLRASWQPGGWRSRAATQLILVSLAVLILPLAISAMQRAPGMPLYFAITILLVVAALLPRRLGRARAIMLIATWVLLTSAVTIAAGIVVPAATLMMCIYAAMLAVFFGLTGLFVAVGVTALIVASVLFIQFGLGHSPQFGDAPLLTDPSIPSNIIRISVIAISFVTLLAFAISYVVRQQENAIRLLENETRERILAERAFQEAQKAQLVSQVTSGLAHNFGNALMVISTWAELIKRHPDDPDYLDRGIADVSAASLQAAAIARQIMVVGKNYVRRPERVNLREELARQIALAATLLPASIVFDEQLNETPDVYLDRSELQQGILNLLLNARDAVDGAGQISIVLTSEDGHVLLSVTDDGVGMTENVRAQIFDPFFTTKGVQGTGLGLASLKKSVEAADGTITVTSSPNKGATFTLRFPAMEAASTSSGVARAENAVDAAAARILVVDDEEMVRDVIATALRSFGYTVIDAVDVADGIERIRETEALDLLLSDAVMPGGNLTDLLTVFEQRFPERPVIVCSGYMRDEIGARFIQERGLEFIQKPVDFDELRTRVANLLSVRKQRHG